MNNGASDGAKLITIVDNGGRPFRVKISQDEKDISVYRTKGNAEGDVSRDKLWKEFRANRVFVGYDPCETNPEENLWWFGGNSVLFQLEECTNRYVYVGGEIFEFEAAESDRIVEYVSTMGNNLVPYPFALGERWTYLFLEDVYFPSVDWASLEDRDAYHYYYDSYKEKQERYGSNRLPAKRVIHARRWGRDSDDES